MTLDELGEWEEEFVDFQARFAPLFVRSEPREQAAKYMRGLLGPVERKNGWQIAEAVADRGPDRTERLLYKAIWDADAARDKVQRFILERFGDPEGIGVLDETGFIKKGEHSAGVQRQYSGTAGKVENCQIGTFLSYATTKGHVLLDRRLYLPQGWCEDAERRKAAKIPAEVMFQTKTQQALSMLQHAWQQGIPMKWVTGDEVYGDSPVLRAALDEHGQRYVLAVASTTPVWSRFPALQRTEEPARASARAKKTPAPSTIPSAQTVAQVVASWPRQRWKRLSVAEGEKGPITYDWARAQVVESRNKQPAGRVWLLARRSVSDPSEIAYYLSNAPAHASLLEMAQAAATRYTVEQCFEEAKGEAGLDQYEVRYWHSWYRHITLSMMAHTFLASIRAMEAEKGGYPTRCSPN
jgi:SRSO17 transposase